MVASYLPNKHGDVELTTVEGGNGRDSGANGDSVVSLHEAGAE